MPFAATWMDLDTVILSEVNQRKTSIMIAYMWHLGKKWYKWTDKTEIVSQMQKTSCYLGEGGVGNLGGRDWHIHTHLYIKQITNKDLLRASQVAQVVKNPPANTGDARGVGSIPGSGRFPWAGNGTPRSMPVWKISWAEKRGRLLSTGPQRFRHDWAHTRTYGIA